MLAHKELETLLETELEGMEEDRREELLGEVGKHRLGGVNSSHL